MKVIACIRQETLSHYNSFKWTRRPVWLHKYTGLLVNLVVKSSTWYLSVSSTVKFHFLFAKWPLERWGRRAVKNRVILSRFPSTSSKQNVEEPLAAVESILRMSNCFLTTARTEWEVLREGKKLTNSPRRKSLPKRCYYQWRLLPERWFRACIWMMTYETHLTYQRSLCYSSFMPSYYEW